VRRRRKARIWGRLLIALLLVSTPAAAQYSYIGGQNKVRYDVFDWKTYDTPHFKISFYDRVEPRLEKVASFAESSYDDLARRLNFQILEPIPMITYATHGEFEQTNVRRVLPEESGLRDAGPQPDGVAGRPLDRELQQLIQHELTTSSVRDPVPGARWRRLRAPPDWFMEGMASYFGDDETAATRCTCRTWRCRTWCRRSTYAGWVPRYRYGHKVFQFIEEEWGEDGSATSCSPSVAWLVEASSVRSRTCSTSMSRSSTPASRPGSARGTRAPPRVARRASMGGRSTSRE
jgi:hypothetical protein